MLACSAESIWEGSRCQHAGARCLLSGCLPGHGGKHRQPSVVGARNVPRLASLELTLVTQTCLRFTEALENTHTQLVQFNLILLGTAVFCLLL